MKPTSDIYDDHLENVRVLDSRFVHFGGRVRFHGTAVTLKAYEDFSRVVDLVSTQGSGRVLVIDGGGSRRCALIGDSLAAKALNNGWAGVVIWGAVRDRVELAKLDLGVMALGATPRKSNRDGAGQVDVAVTLDGVPCNPGDLVVADEDGVIIASSDVARQILDQDS